MIHNETALSARELASDERWAGGDFARLVDICMPSRTGYVAMIEAYFDESDQNGWFSVAGLVFAKPQAKKLEREWRKLFAPYGGVCHMTDLHAQRGAFAGIDKTEAGRLTVQAVRLILDRASYGAASACRLDEIDAHLPKHIDGFGHAYPFLCHMTMFALGDLVARTAPERIAYFFERGAPHQAEAQRMMALADRQPQLGDSYQMYSYAFIPKDSASAVQAADVFAWEYSRYWDLTVDKKKIPMRRSLTALLTSGFQTLDYKKRFAITRFTGPPLWNALAKFRALLGGG